MRSSLFLLLTSIFTFGYVTAVTAAVPGFDQLSETRRRDFILAAMEQRYVAMSNLSYTVDVRTVRISLPDGERTLLFHDRIEFRRFADTFWMHGRYGRFQTEDDIAIDTATSWNGKNDRSLSLPNPAATQGSQVGMVDITEANNFVSLQYNELLGLRTKGSPVANSEPVFAWIRDACKLGCKFEVPPASPSSSTLSITVHQLADETRTYFLDISRGYMISRIEKIIKMKDTARTPDIYSVETWQRAGGLWIPSLATYRGAEVAGRPRRAEVTYKLAEVSVGNVKQSDVDIIYPPGTKVIDNVNNAAYIVRPGGKYQLIPFGDANTHEVRVPPKDAVVTKIDVSTHTLYSSAPLVFGNPTKARPVELTPTRLTLFLGSLALTAAGFIAIVRHRKRMRAARSASQY